MTQIFLDTANIKEIEEIKTWKIFKGITTNQKIFLKEKGCDFETRAKQILELAHPLPVSLEATSNTVDGLVKEGKNLAELKDNNDHFYKNVVIKIPMLKNGDGLKAVGILYDMGIKTNVTACMTLNQTFLAMSAGATYVSLFYNRMKDWRKSLKMDDVTSTLYAWNTITYTMRMLEEGGYKTELIVGSIRSALDIEEIATAGPDIITIPTSILIDMSFNTKTEETLKDFDKAWKEFCKK
jgi:transaldolase